VWHGLDVLGYRVFPHSRRLRNDNGWRFVRTLRAFARAYAAGRMEWAEIDPSVQSWVGHAAHADTLSLRQWIFSGIVFRRAFGKG
jgi:RNA-directed DNA polymerase